jgi:hypothetical protein
VAESESPKHRVVIASLHAVAAADGDVGESELIEISNILNELGMVKNQLFSVSSL